MCCIFDASLIWTYFLVEFFYSNILKWHMGNVAHQKTTTSITAPMCGHPSSWVSFSFLFCYHFLVFFCFKTKMMLSVMMRNGSSHCPRVARLFESFSVTLFCAIDAINDDASSWNSTFFKSYKKNISTWVHCLLYSFKNKEECTQSCRPHDKIFYLFLFLHFNNWQMLCGDVFDTFIQKNFCVYVFFKFSYFFCCCLSSINWKQQKLKSE